MTGKGITGMGTGTRRMYVHPHTQLKSRGFSLPIFILSQCRDFLSKQRRVRVIPTRTSLFGK